MSRFYPQLPKDIDWNSNILVVRNANSLNISLYLLERNPEGIPINFLVVGKNGVLKRKKFNEDKPLPLLVINEYGSEWLIDLLDLLLDMGIQPKKNVITKQEEIALKSHLKDMRLIVSKKLGVNLDG